MAQAPIRISGPKLAEARIRSGLTQSGLAALVGLNRSSINRIESGQHSASAPTLVALAAALGVDIDTITDRSAA